VVTASLLCLAACSLQDHFVYVPDTSPPDLASLGLPAVKAVSLTTADDLSLLAWWLPPRGAAPVVIYCHGNGGNIGGRGYRLQRLAREGFGVLMLEYRGYGGNPGHPSEEGLYADGRAALKFLDAQGIAPERRVLYGESLGTGVAVHLASEQAVGALVLEAPYTNLGDVGAAHFPAILVRLVLRDRFDSLSQIKSVRAPVLIMHGERDQVIPVGLGRTLYTAANPPKEVWYVAQGNHNDLAGYGALERAIEFINQHTAA
jgi:fermentation-respiration switch protein FrsA (DUF1100 family)